MRVKAEIKSICNGYNSNLKAIVNVVLDDVFIIKSVKILEGFWGLYVVMPSCKNKFGEFQEFCHPIKNDFRIQINDAVILEYKAFMSII